MNEPKDLGIKIGTPLEAKWTQAKKNWEEALLNNAVEKELLLSNIELAKKKISEVKK